MSHTELWVRIMLTSTAMCSTALTLQWLFNASPSVKDFFHIASGLVLIFGTIPSTLIFTICLIWDL